MKLRHVYILSSKSGVIFYVGSTCNPKTRLSSHKCAKNGISNKIKDLIRLDEFKFSIIESHDNKYGCYYEDKWIHAFYMCGHPLMNKKITTPINVIPEKKCTSKFIPDIVKRRLKKRKKVKEFYLKSIEKPFIQTKLLKTMEIKFGIDKLTILKILKS